MDKPYEDTLLSTDTDLTEKAAVKPPPELSLTSRLEAILLASAKPLKLSEIYEILRDDVATIKKISAELEQIKLFYEQRGGGFHLETSKGFQLKTIPATAFLMERMFSGKPRPLSRSAQETLAIIAYRQPVTRADIEFIRGVDAGSIIKNLLERELICCLGRKSIVGRPLTFGTTEEFLRVYGLADLSQLPPLESFQPQREIIKEALKTLEEEGSSEGSLPLSFSTGQEDEQQVEL